MNLQNPCVTKCNQVRPLAGKMVKYCPHAAWWWNLLVLGKTGKWISQRGLIFAAFSAYLSEKRAWKVSGFFSIIILSILFIVHQCKKMHNAHTDTIRIIKMQYILPVCPPLSDIIWCKTRCTVKAASSTLRPKALPRTLRSRCMCFHRNSATCSGSHGGVISWEAAFGENCRKKQQ